MESYTTETFSLARAVFEFGAPQHGERYDQSPSPTFDPSEVIERLQRALTCSEPPSRASLERILRDRSGAETAEIDAENCTFRFNFGRGGGLYGIPPWATDQLPPPHLSQQAPPIEMASNSLETGFVAVRPERSQQLEAQFERAHQAASLVWNQYMRRSFDAAVAANKLRLEGRVGSATSEKVELPTDLWPLIEVQDWTHGLAVDPSGVVYWSIRVAQANSDQIEPDTTKRPNRPSFDRAAMAVADLYPDGVPAQSQLPDVHLCRTVADWLKQKKLLPVSDSTIRRAAGRRGK